VESALALCVDGVRVHLERVGAQEEEYAKRDAHVRSLELRWSGLGLNGEISEASIESVRGEVERKQKKLAGIKSRLSAIRGDVERATVFDMVNERARRRIVDAGFDSELDYAQWMQNDLSQAKQQQYRIEECVRLVVSISARLDAAAGAYVENVARPLGERANRFYRALSSFHRRALVLEPRVVSSQRTELRVHIALDGESTRDRDAELSAQHMLSEGQMSEASLSLMLAMSTGFRWSRWPALLLDDPLQQNDVIHVASFLDVICNLVKDQSYQVVIATHDLELADFMKRKVRAARVRCRVYRFIYPGRAELDVDD
jgi:DNA repair exonuclease SbcCD ATPase subunit